LSAFLASGSSIDVINKSYLLASLVFAMLIGAVIMILEWGKSRSPADIFMSALALPALLSGSLNTAEGVHTSRQTTQVNLDLIGALEKSEQIKTLPYQKIVPLGKTAIKPAGSPTSFEFNFISKAYADDIAPRETSFDLGINVITQSYYIVLDKAATETEAQHKMTALPPSQVPNASIVKGGDGSFFVIANPAPSPHSKAVLDVIKLKKSLGGNIAIELLEAR
jgi:hypothetical protein